MHTSAKSNLPLLRKGRSLIPPVSRLTPSLLSICLALLVSCSGDKQGKPPQQEGATGASTSKNTRKLRIAVIPKGTTHDFWKMIHAGALQAERDINERARESSAQTSGADKETLEISIIWKGPLKEDATREQQDIVETFLNAGLSGICLAPLDKSALVPQVAAAREAEIPVIVFDSGVDGVAGTDFVSYVATDNFLGGQLAGRRLARTLGGKGRVVLLRYQVGSESTTQRENGFLEAIKKEFPDIEIVSDRQYAGATESEAFNKSQNLLTSLEGRFDGIFCPNESSTSGMLNALQQADLAGKVRLVGFDASERLIEALRKGHVHGLVLQNPLFMAYESVRLMVEHLEGRPVPERVDTGVVVATPKNVDDPKMVALHSPDLSILLSE